MAAEPLPIATYRLPSPRASSARLLNCFAEKAPPGSRKQAVMLRRAPGIAAWQTLGSGPVRGMCMMGSELYVLSGDTLSRINSAGTVTPLTGTVPGSERVRMQTNGFDLVIVRPTDNTGYVASTTAVAQIVDVVFTGWGARDVDFIDGYFIFRRPNSQQMFNSGLNAVTFNALDIVSAEGAPDDLNGLIVDRRDIFLPGTQSSELFYDAANTVGSPFSRSPQGLLGLGSGAEYSPAKVEDVGVCLLTSDLTVRQLRGLSLERISQYGIESEIQRFATTSDAFGMSYTMDGHIFYVLQFPSAGRTFLYDLTSGEWCERDSLGYGAWRVNCIVRAFGKVIVGDSQSGKVGILDPDVFTEWGDPQRCSWTYQGVYGDNNRISHVRFELVLNGGHGRTTGQGSNPLATLFASDDGGETFTAQPTKSLGELGHYDKRVVWWRLGSSRDRVYRVDVTDPVPLFVVDTQLDAIGDRG